MEDKKKKNAKLRNNEYYVTQELQDYLYNRSKENTEFNNLMQYIYNDNNIRLAYRNIKKNKGSKTKGLSGKNIKFLGRMKLWKFISDIKKLMRDYKPFKIKRVGIPKSNGKIRYLGIQEPEEKIIEQAILQILNPICMAKFHNNSNGFIEGRSCKRAIAQFEQYILKDKLYFVVDIDIKGFFDNINHGKLLKQLWSLKIRDKNLITLISKMLKAEILQVGIPETGTPQGGILSPLLANIVLNELDWWLDSFKEKGIKFVRYADDFKILCPTYLIAKNMLRKTSKWLRKRLKLQVSEEKTKIVNLKNNYSEFLGFRIKVKKQKDIFVINSRLTEKAMKNCKIKLKKQVRKVVKNKNNKAKLTKNVDLYNSQVMGIQNYYCLASRISYEFSFLNFILKKYIIRNCAELNYIGRIDKKYHSILKRFGGANKLIYIRGKPIAPIGNVKYEIPYGISTLNFYDKKSRNEIHDELSLDNTSMIEKIVNKPFVNESLEFNDNIISKFCGQYGTFAITSDIIYDVNDIAVIRKNNYKNDDSYKNLTLVNKKVERLTSQEDVSQLNELAQTITRAQLDKINEIRKENNLALIEISYA